MHTFVHMHANSWADLAFSLCSTAPKVADGVNDDVGLHLPENMRKKGKKTE